MIQLARQFPDYMIGIHLNAGSAGPCPTLRAGPTKNALGCELLQAYRAAEMDYFGEHQHKPQTVAFALSDSPLAPSPGSWENSRSGATSNNTMEGTFHEGSGCSPT